MGVDKSIRMLREAHDMTQQQLADAVEVTREAVAKWESGVAQPRMNAAIKLATMFGVTLDELASGVPKIPARPSNALKPDERELLELYRSLDVQGREMALYALRGMASHEHPSHVAEGKLA